MIPFLIAVGSAFAFILAYNTYGKWLGKKIFRLSADAVCPSVSFQDDVDYCPTSSGVIFGHHFTSIAGTGPIVGPAIAIMWGWVPALVWVLFGSIFIGAVHDFGSLVVSIRNNGQTVGDIAGRVINPRVRFLFLFVLFMALTIVLAIFGLVIAAVFKQYPTSIFPCLIQIPIAVIIGATIHRKGKQILMPSVIALVVMYLTVFFGNSGFLADLNAALAAWPIATWVVLLLIYSYIASVLPVWILLQPRDYINSLQLISALGLVVLGLIAAAFFGGAPLEGVRPELTLVAPAVNLTPQGAPPIFPFLFITIACGAVSGFHCLVSSGTSSKQLRSEPDARFIGYGSMLTEGFLAVLVILACAAGLGLGVVTGEGEVLTGEVAWMSRYGSWGAAQGLGAKVGAFVDGAANFLAALGIPAQAGIALMGVLVASFAATTLDTACRLQRYVIQELADTLPRSKALKPLRDKHGATIFAIAIAAVIAMWPNKDVLFGFTDIFSAEGRTVIQDYLVNDAGKGGMLLWPLFGATNQLLGGLAFLVITFYLWRRGIAVWFCVIPMVIMLLMPLWAMTVQVFIGTEVTPSWLADRNWLLVGIGVASLLLEVWMIVEALLLLPKVKGLQESPAPLPAHVKP